MRLEQGIKTVLTQKQVLTSRQMQSLRLLALNNIELDAVLLNEYLENPLLENRNVESNGGNSGEYSGEYQQWYQNAVSETEDIYSYLWEQMDMTKYSRQEQEAINVMIGCLDDNGFFKVPLEQIQLLVNVPIETIGKCLNELRQLEPVGIFSSDMAECLIFQLNRLGIEDPVLNVIIKEYLEELSQGKIAAVTRKLNISSSTVRRYLSVIAKLDPRPMLSLGKNTIDYIIPDVIVSRSSGGYEVKINDSWLANYQINDYYAAMLNNTGDPDLSAYFKEKQQRARFFIEAVEQRRKTIIDIVKALIELQGGSLSQKSKFKPVTMQQIASKLGINISTVSRAVKDKYIQYPYGTIAMKELFTSAVGSSNHDEVSVFRIKELLKEIINEEEKKQPYSDAKLAELLKKNGITLSRRAVAKYRDELGIKGSFDRKIND